MKLGKFPQGTSFRPLMTQGPFNAQVARGSQQTITASKWKYTSKSLTKIFRILMNNNNSSTTTTNNNNNNYYYYYYYGLGFFLD